MSDLMMVIEQLDASQQNLAATHHVAATTSAKADVSLTKDLAVALVRKLAVDDGFRLSYEANPAQALAAIGVSRDVIDRISPENLTPLKLADKQTFQEALELLRADAATICLCQIPPQIGIDVATPSRTKLAPLSVPFKVA